MKRTIRRCENKRVEEWKSGRGPLFHSSTLPPPAASAVNLMRVLFFGTAEFAVPSLEALAESGRHEVLAVVTQPDRAQGRGLKVAYSPVKQAALRLGLPVMQPRRVRSEQFLREARELQPEALALAAFGQIIPQP